MRGAEASLPRQRFAILRPRPSRRPVLGLLVGLLVLVLPLASLPLWSAGQAGRTPADYGNPPGGQAAAAPYAWQNVSAPSPNPNLSLVRQGRLFDGGQLLLAVEVAGNALGDSAGQEGAYFFVDADADAATGFPVLGIGADLLVQVLGSSGDAVNASVSVRSVPDSGAWSDWQPEEAALATVRGSVLEVGVPLLRADPAPGFAVVVVMTDFLGNETHASSQEGNNPTGFPGTIVPRPVPGYPKPWPPSIPEFPVLPLAVAAPALALWLVRRRARHPS